MTLVTHIVLIIIASIHFYILYLEMFLWNSKKGMKIFGIDDKEFANQTKELAANQGLYNGFLAVGILFSIYKDSSEIAIFFLICIGIAGIFGAVSTKKVKILWIQSIPAIIGILSIVLSIK